MQPADESSAFRKLYNQAKVLRDERKDILQHDPMAERGFRKELEDEIKQLDGIMRLLVDTFRRDTERFN